MSFFLLPPSSLLPPLSSLLTNNTPDYEDEPTEARQAVAGGMLDLKKAEEEASMAPGWFCSPSDYEQYLSNSLPPRFQCELERQVQQEFGFGGDERQTQRVVDMVQQLQLRLFKQFRQERTAGLSQHAEGG